MKQWVQVVVIMVVFGAACKKPQDFQFLGVRNLGLEMQSLNAATISAELAYYNPNKFGVKVKHIDAEVFANGNSVGSYTLDTLMQIPARENFVFPARLEIKNMQSVFSSALSFLANKEIILRVVGKTKAGKGAVFVTIPFDFTTTQKLEIKF